jgi:hypothetical protein
MVMQELPHVVPYAIRVKLFRNHVRAEGVGDPDAPTRITVRRQHVLEDGEKQVQFFLC